MKGLIYDMQRFAIHDGPGIRTLIYMKGCPLKCLWCSSPQTQKPSTEILHIELNCKKCGRCTEVCSKNAITISEEEGVKIDRKLCDSCGECVETCLNQALKLAGKDITVEELFQEVNKDSPFYRRSKGGITVGGGEPTMQHEFVTAFLKRCKQIYIHTAMESCGYVKWEYLEKILKHLNLAYFDIKHMDPLVHKELTGVSNELILENIKKASKMLPVIIRIPVAPGCNDSEDNILATAKFAAGLGKNLQRIEILPYHKFGTHLYDQLDMEYRLKDVEPPSDEHMERLKELIESCGVKAQIGG
jgi:pyruvate formate lyase activating enzyme